MGSSATHKTKPDWNYSDYEIVISFMFKKSECISKGMSDIVKTKTVFVAGVFFQCYFFVFAS